MNMMVTLAGGCDADLHPAFLTFTNENRSFPFRGVDDSIPSVSYRTAPKGFIYCTVIPIWLAEK